jgi:hypothetical protein
VVSLQHCHKWMLKVYRLSEELNRYKPKMPKQ